MGDRLSEDVKNFASNRILALGYALWVVAGDAGTRTGQTNFGRERSRPPPETSGDGLRYCSLGTQCKQGAE